MGKLSLKTLSSLFTMSDEQAMWRVQTADDSAAFARLVERWRAPVQRLCERMLGDSHRAEDLAQEAFVRVFARRKEYRAAGRFSTFLWRVALNLCYDELRRVRSRGELPIDADADEQEANLVSPETPPDDQLVNAERAEGVRRALAQLPDPYRTVIVLRHYENLKFREIAEVLEIPEGTVKSRTAEAMVQLGRLLREPRKNFLKATQRLPLIRNESLVL